jgi:hypothetical protein
VNGTLNGLHGMIETVNGTLNGLHGTVWTENGTLNSLHGTIRTENSLNALAPISFGNSRYLLFSSLPFVYFLTNIKKFFCWIIYITFL